MRAGASDTSLFIGLMSGTSLDGVDAVLADCSTSPPKTLAHAHRAFADDLRVPLAVLCTSGSDEIERAGVASRALAQVYAASVDDLLSAAGVERSSVRAIGAHGQTVRHRPGRGFSMQLNAAALLAELTAIDVVADFRSRDIAAGGQGAPLAPIFHQVAFSAAAPRAVVNIGGISNLTALPGDDAPVIGFDCGPGNLLIDAWTARHFHKPFDSGGAIAASADVDQRLLQTMLAEPFFASTPPKSTGRELFSLEWLERAIGGRSIDTHVIAATLTRLTAVVIARAIDRWFADAADVVVCGGGARNATMMRMLEAECAPRPVFVSSALGVEPEHVEALAFAWLAYAHVSRQPGNVPSVTGARGARTLGALYPA